jgi:ATP-dependent Lon protease
MSAEAKTHSYMTRSKLNSQKDKNKQYKRNESSDSDNDSEWTSGEEIDEEIDMHEYRKFLAKIFPSQYALERAGKKIVKAEPKSADSSSDNKKADKKGIKKDNKKDKELDEELDEEKTKEKSSKAIKKSFNKLKKNRNVVIGKSKKKDKKSEEESDISDSDLDDSKPSNFNIIFTIGSGHDDEYDDEEYDDEYDEDDEDDEEDDDEDDEDEEDDDEDEEEEEDDEDEEEKHPKKCIKEADEDKNSESDLLAIEKLRTTINEIKKMDGSSKLIKNLMSQLESAEQIYEKGKNKQIKKTKTKNTKKFISLLRDKNMMNDVRFFKEKMSVDEQDKIITQMEIIKKHCQVEKPYKLTLLEADIPPEFKAVAYKKINTLKYMEPGGGEYYKIKQWIDTFMQIPFGKYKNLPVTLQDDGPDRCSEFMDYAKKTLDGAVYGMNDVKLQVMQLVGQWITNPRAVGTAVAIKGPMGTGKTTLVKDGISKILGRDFAFIALGGATDSSFLEGHSYTYEGSMWGKIIDILVQCKSMNPVIFLDELDKVSETPKGEEIIGILTHLTDTTQNSKFHDKYFAELDFDLSRALFIFSYNDENKINPILRDRMYRVQTKGYDMKEKTIIANNYLLPKIREQVSFNKDDIIIPDETMSYIISNHTESEDGVRNLKRCLEIIYTKLNLYRLMKPGTNLFESEMSLKVSFPMTITNDIVDKLIKNNKEMGGWHNMYM